MLSITVNETAAVVVEESDDGGDESTNEVMVVVVIDDHCIGSTLLTNFYRSIKFMKLNSNIIVQDNIAISNEIIFHTKSSPSIPPQLLYRGTRDGFKAEDFHSRCDNQGPTLTIIKSEASNELTTNRIFGGFTTQSWKSSSGAYFSDDSAFIFKIASNQQQQLVFKKFNVKQNKKQYAICDNKDYLPVFGSGSDICIANDCNLNQNSYSNFGFTYELLNEDKFKYGSLDRGYLAGTFNFKVLEIEVFKITITTSATTTDIQQ